MALIKRKTRQALGRHVRKLVKKHGTEIATGLATAAVTAIIDRAVGVGDAGHDADGGGKKKKNKKNKKKKKGKKAREGSAEGGSDASDDGHDPHTSDDVRRGAERR